MTVLIGRVDMFDAAGHECSSSSSSPIAIPPSPPVAHCAFHNDPQSGPVSVVRLPSVRVEPTPQWMSIKVIDRATPCPYGEEVVKYWNQRRRLFSRFDQGIELDREGWFSVTPEQIADHVAARVAELARGRSIVLLDAFCGCGGNAIAFAKLPNVKVVATDIDRTKLRKAAHNASLYGIPPSRLVFCELNAVFLLEHCYRDGNFVLDQPLSDPESAMKLMNAMPPPVDQEVVDGYAIGGIDLLPRTIDAIFMDPPWGGMDYEVFGKNGYDLQRHMRILRPGAAADWPDETNALQHDFFDSFMADPRSKSERKAQFNCTIDDTNCVNGAELVRLAAQATATHWIIYDLPRNTNRTSLGATALAAGYSGQCKLEEHYLNGRLKTATAYLGSDWL